jgi:hypothetical protein
LEKPMVLVFAIIVARPRRPANPSRRWGFIRAAFLAHLVASEEDTTQPRRGEAAPVNPKGEWKGSSIVLNKETAREKGATGKEQWEANSKAKLLKFPWSFCIESLSDC